MLQKTDTEIGQIVDTIKARPNYSDEDWLVILSTDHSGEPELHHGANIPEHRLIPFIMNGPSVIDVQQLSYHYSTRVALREVSFQIQAGEVFAFLGPNGSGKTTLFRVLSTLVPVQQGSVQVLGTCLVQQADAVRERLGVRPGELVLGFCGELREKKGMSFLLAAFREIRQRREACLLVIGEVRPREQSKLTEFAVESPDAAARILVTEHLETAAEVASCLNVCDIVLQPSLWDGMPNSVLEAMACGRVVLGSDAGGMPEVIDHDATGFLVPRVQLGALGVAIEEVAGLSDSRRAEIGAAAAKHVRTHFNAEVEATALAEIVARLQAV